MGKKIKIWIISVVIIGVSLNLGMYIYVKIAQHQAKDLFQQVKNHDKVFVYETYYGALNAVLYVDELKDTTELVNYYVKTARHDSTASFNFAIKYMPLTLHEPIYVLNYLNKGSKLVQLVDFDDKCWGYITGYVYIANTHKNPPSDSLITAKEAFLMKFNSNKDVKMMSRIAKKISDYGWYCDN